MGTDYTNGWDICMATSFGNISKLLAYAYEHNLTPRQANGEGSVRIFEVDLQVRGNATLGAWSVSGGAGQDVIVNVPFTGGSAQIGTKTCALSGVSLQVTVLLRFIKSTVSGGGTKYQLNINLTDLAAIRAVNLLKPPPNLTAEEKWALTMLLRHLLLNSSLAGAGVTIATLDLAKYAGLEPWFIPKGGIDYAAATGAGPGGGTLALFLATINPAPGRAPIIQSGIIPPGCDSALIISNQIFTQQFLAPAFAPTIDTQTSRLSYSGRNPMIVSGSGSAGGVTISSAQASADNGQVDITLRGSKSPMEGVNVNFTIRATYAIALGGTAREPVISFKLMSQSESHSIDIAWWVYLVAGVTAGAIGVLVVAMIRQVVNDWLRNLPIGSPPADFVRTIDWPFGGVGRLTEALLPLPLQLGGTITT